MTVKQLKEALSKCPDNMQVFIAATQTDFAYGLLNSVRMQTITFSEDPLDTKPAAELPQEEVVILDEE
ncbi:MAG: hypothetical protein QM791_04205 [Ferruginibacter sp.]